jgi:hypothetical protein
VLIVGGALLVAVVLVVATVVLATRAGPSVTGSSSQAAAPSPAPSVEPTSTPSPGTSPQTGADQQRYRPYVSSLIVDGSGLIAATTELQSCISSDRSGCIKALNDARDRINSFQSDLDANPPPSCLTGTDPTLRAGLGFYLKGIDLAKQGVNEHNRLKLAQGSLLIAAGTFRTGQAVHAARNASC